LERFGYISSDIAETRHAPGSALRRFQSYAGIPLTGVLDTATLNMMQRSRCGVKDWNPKGSSFEDFSARRRKRYAIQGTKWNHNDLTYRIDKYTPDLPRAVVDATIAKALNFWGQVSKLTFTAKPAGHVDIRIIFQAGEHGDDEAFDGRGGVLAHAYFPFDNRRSLWGDAHFDDAEQWTVRSYRGQNLLYVAVHEFGHSLGISHSKTKGAIMWPWAGEYIPNFKLQQDDIQAIQAIYGKPDSATTTAAPTTTTTSAVVPSGRPTPPTPPGDDGNCAGKIDAIEVFSDGEVYSFRGANVYKLNHDGVVAGWPKLITQVFPSSPSYVDAALTVKEWDTTYLFKGNQYWRYSYKNGRFMSHDGYPRPLTRWGLPATVRNLDAAFQWGADEKVYFIKGNRFYSFNVDRRRLDRQGYMSSGWRGLPAYGVTGAMQYTNGRTYFFSRTGLYYRWNDDDDVVDTANPRFPRNTGEWWFGCK